MATNGGFRYCSLMRSDGGWGLPCSAPDSGGIFETLTAPLDPEFLLEEGIEIVTLGAWYGSPY